MSDPTFDLDAKNTEQKELDVLKEKFYAEGGEVEQIGRHVTANPTISKKQRTATEQVFATKVNNKK